MVTDSRGRPLGKYKSPVELPRDQIEIVRQFLIRISKQKGSEQMSDDKKERTNLVYLAGVLKFDPKVFDSNTGCLIDVGLKGSIQCTIYTGENAPEGNDQLARKLKQFKEGDFIKVVAMLRPYGVKQGDTWKNSISIDITAIKTDPPRREQKRQEHDEDSPW